MKNNTSNTRYSTKWHSAEQVDQFNRTLNTAGSEETLRKASRETTNLTNMEECSRTNYCLIWHLKSGKAENTTIYWATNIFYTVKNTLPHLIDSINRYVHQYQKVLHELSPKSSTRDHSVGHQNKHAKVKTLQEKP